MDKGVVILVPGRPEDYALEFFRREGFVRKKCRYCGEYFWTLNPKQEHCNDAPCVEYYFWDIERVRDLSVANARRLFIEFFKKKGHKPVSPRPVVARWREDLYLTIASIVVFQPHVTKGIVPPPANPLVIVQPCIRLEDIDNVGVTFGRHLTSFEMGGHHAFNYPDKSVYWKEETVEYAFEFFTKELGIPPELVTFKESWWEGGGNAGPSFEVAVGGLELATLVFMQYDVVNGSYKELPLKIVDTGYGIERIAWFSQEVPTSFHAIYGELVGKFFEILGVEQPSEKLLWEAARLAGRLDPDNPESRERFIETVSRRTGLDRTVIIREFDKSAAVFGLLDHTRTLALMLGDGIVPSNSGEGYLARLVLRRALRLVRRLGASVSLKDLVLMQIEYWSRDYYPQLARHKSYILDVVEYEENRYINTIKESMRKVEKIVKKKRKLTIDDLVYFYDSHGLPPDMVKEVASKYGIEVEVPANFYSIVASRHGASGVIGKQAEKTALPRDVVEWARKLPSTRRLFHENPYLREFEANLLASLNGKYVVLDATAFYPTGGGQLHDTGVISVCGRNYRVKMVEKVDNVIVHVVEPDIPSACVGEKVKGAIDWRRRYKLMRHHTAVHVVLGAARRVLGDHVWQAGAEKTPEKARLDITHYKPLSRDEVDEIERLANNAILDSIPVSVEILDRNTAEEKYGFRIYQGGVPLTPELRIISINGWDVEACFGTHVSNTREIGAIKITNVEKLQDGVIRLELVAGTGVADYAKQLEEIVESVAKTVSAPRDNLVERVVKLLEERKEIRKRLSQLEKRLIAIMVENIASTPKKIGQVNVYIAVNTGLSEDARRELLRKLAQVDPNGLAVVIEESEKGGIVIEASTAKNTGIDLRQLVAEARKLGYKGGGKKDHIVLVAEKDAESAVNEILSVIEKLARTG